jgi:uncharacterized protein (DUF433 family)
MQMSRTVSGCAPTRYDGERRSEAMPRTQNDLSDSPLFTSHPDVMGGRLVFRGTRIPVEVLFDNLADGMSLDAILDAYPNLKRDDAIAAIGMAGVQ